MKTAFLFMSYDFKLKNGSVTRGTCTAVSMNFEVENIGNIIHDWYVERLEFLKKENNVSDIMVININCIH